MMTVKRQHYHLCTEWIKELLLPQAAVVPKMRLQPKINNRISVSDSSMSSWAFFSNSETLVAEIKID